MSEQPNEGYFELFNSAKLSDLEEGKVTKIPESDLALQTDTHMMQFKYRPPAEREGYSIKPGTFTMGWNSTGQLELEPIKMVTRDLLMTATNTQSIMAEARKFFSRLEFYRKFNRPQQRKLLLHSPPGLGKTTSIIKVSQELIAEDPGTVVISWPTGSIEARHVLNFFSTGCKYEEKVTRMVLVIEDIGGGEEDSSGHRGVSSDLLNLLDGIGITFSVPTFIIATTNHPENLLESLANRPGRFDLLLELKYPSHKERLDLMKFITKSDLTDEVKKALNIKGAEKLSIAHLEEAFVRSQLDDKALEDTISELVKHIEYYERGFKKSKYVGIGVGDEE